MALCKLQTWLLANQRAIVERGKLRRKVLVVFLVSWLAHYLHGVRRIRLHFGQGSQSKEFAKSQAVHALMRRIVGRCPSLSAVYWPTWYAHTAVLQFLVLGFKELRSRFLQRNPYERQVLVLRDGARIALDWVVPAVPEHPIGEERPVCVLLHGALQDSSSATMVDLACHLASKDMPVVVMNRRGYGGIALQDPDAKLAMFGFDEDLDEVLGAVSERMPGKLVAVIGFSCGSGFSGRYAGTRSHLSAWNDVHCPDQKARLLCAVAYDPGYDVSPEGAVSKIAPPYSWFMNWGIKYWYVFRHRSVLRQKSASFCNLVGDALSPKRGLTDTYRLTRRLSGAHGSSAFLNIQQPKIDKFGLPGLLINSRDDPICVWDNVREFYDEITSNPHAVLAELHRGSHGCKFDFWGASSVAHTMIAEFVLAAWRELRGIELTRDG